RTGTLSTPSVTTPPMEFSGATCLSRNFFYNALARPAKYRREIGDNLRSEGPWGAWRPRGDVLRCDRAPTAAAQGTDGAYLTSNSDGENFWVDGRSPGRQRSSRPS